MFTIVGFITPLLQWLSMLAYQYCTEHSYLHRVLNTVLPKLLKCVAGNRDGPEYKRIAWIDLIFGWCLSNRSRKYFTSDLLVIRIVNMLTILLTFGAAFPPVAVAGGVAVYTSTYFVEVLVNICVYRLRNSTADGKRMEHIKRVKDSCLHSRELFIHTVWIIAPMITTFYSLFIFDTYGDSGGLVAAIPLSMLMFCSPLLVWLARKLFKCVAKNRKTLSVAGLCVKSQFNYDITQVSIHASS